ncbi:hypothetical protein ACO0LV_11550 [Pseudactinotalea sp. Z1739]|uniref:hypothetical protein n=1 Tax=Pseudactinotalea sp. Z1739 TaxID=3413028 RepID=UPI003C7AF0C0
MVTLAVFAGYVATVLGRAQTPITATAYQVPLLVAVGVAVIATVVLRVLVEIVRPSETYRADSRDRDIDRLGVIRSWGLVVAGALAALVMALAEWPHFWIANALYLSFVLHAAMNSVVKLVAYRQGL